LPRSIINIFTSPKWRVSALPYETQTPCFVKIPIPYILVKNKPQCFNHMIYTSWQILTKFGTQ